MRYRYSLCCALPFDVKSIEHQRRDFDGGGLGPTDEINPSLSKKVNSCDKDWQIKRVTPEQRLEFINKPALSLAGSTRSRMSRRNSIADRRDSLDKLCDLRPYANLPFLG